LIEEINDTTLINEIGFVYYSEMGRYFFNKSEYKESLPYSENAYRIERKNADAENLFISSIILSYSDMRNISGILDSLNNYAGKYPELADNNKFQGLRYSIILNLCNRSFSMHDGTKALEYLSMFENLLPPDYSDLDVSLISKDIVNAYSKAASYYYRKGNYSKAKKYLEKGLEFVPGNYELLIKLNSVR
jgi:tetratricopeptide (TPR) repeat protein